MLNFIFYYLYIIVRYAVNAYEVCDFVLDNNAVVWYTIFIVEGYGLGD